MNQRRRFLIASSSALALPLLCAPAIGQERRVRIGIVTTLSGPTASLGREIVDGFELARRHLGGRIGGVETEVISGDDQLRPDAGKALAERMVQRDRVDFLTGIVFTNVLLALSDAVLRDRRGVFLVNSNAGPSELAGRDCHPNFFSVSWQNDNMSEAMGQHMTDAGIRRPYIMAPNYAAGRDLMNGFKRYFKGELAGEVYTQLGQMDYAAELATLRAARPGATFAFYPGGMGVAFVRQYAQLGLKEQIPLYLPSFSADQTIIPAVGDAALGIHTSTFWSESLENPQNERFVRDFETAYNRIPSPYAAQSYDAANLIDSAVKAANGNVQDKQGIRAALRAANFNSVRGPFRFNANHFPIQNYYLTQIGRDERGRIVNQMRGIIFSAHGDAYAAQCRMRSF